MEDQYGFVQKRNIAHPIRNIINVLTHGQQQKLSLLKLDVYKAFDTLSQEYLWQIMAKYGMGGPYMEAVKEIYREATAVVRVNEIHSQPVQIQRGVRQGCPLSPILFILAIEQLAERLRNSARIDGYKIGKEEMKINLFADDIIVVMTNPVGAMKEIKIILKDFENGSGLSVNMAKSEIMHLNITRKERKSIDSFTNIGMGTKSFKYLGIVIQKKIEKTSEYNYNMVWKGIKKDMKKWKRKILSLTSRINSTKMFWLPRLTYLFQTLPLNMYTQKLEQWNRAIREWIFGSKRCRTQKRMIYGLRSEMGWGVPDLISYYEAFQLKSLMEIGDGAELKWVRFENAINKGMGSFGVFTKYLKKDLKQVKGPRFSTLIIWNKWQPKWLKRTSRWAPVESLYSDAGENRWCDRLRLKGYYKLKDLFRGGTLIPAQDLTEEVGRQYWLKITGLYGMINEINRMGDLWTDEPIEELYKRMQKMKQGIAGCIYRRMLTNKEKALGWLQKTWSKESQISDNVANKIMKGIEDIKAIKFAELEYKFFTKWYKTPAQLANMFAGLTPVCWHCKQSKGWYSHMWWECSEARNFWLKIVSIIKKVCNTVLAVDFDLMLASILENTVVNKEAQATLKAMVSAGKAVIALGWKDKNKWTTDIWHSYVFDFVQSDIIEKMRQKTTWETKVQEVKTKWKAYLTWIVTEGRHDIRWKIQTLCPWLGIKD